ncbi:uncharacterized protein LOC123939739 isoform X1 [Meles meles]|uniref:uncharacterized protein LOC123939739 isoform X1 n=1 Tax=Meles meles TaxID=9662 RepID=UPI001E69C8C7|nr:uncharacterized protein LOC123939739 isoform X1 [Meles meles]
MSLCPQFSCQPGPAQQRAGALSCPGDLQTKQQGGRPRARVPRATGTGDTQGQAQRLKSGYATTAAGRLQPPDARQGRRPPPLQPLEEARHGDTLITDAGRTLGTRSHPTAREDRKVPSYAEGFPLQCAQMERLFCPAASSSPGLLETFNSQGLSRAGTRPWRTDTWAQEVTRHGDREGQLPSAICLQPGVSRWFGLTCGLSPPLSALRWTTGPHRVLPKLSQARWEDRPRSSWPPDGRGASTGACGRTSPAGTFL